MEKTGRSSASSEFLLCQYSRFVEFQTEEHKQVVRFSKSMEEPSTDSKTTFTFSEIVKITSNFKTVIGKGGFGEVYFGTTNDGTPVAVKVLSPSSRQGYQEFLAEAKLLTIVHHENLVSVVGFCDDDGNKALIYDYMPNGNLRQHLSEKRKTTLIWIERLQIAFGVACGLEYLHGCKPPIVHRDLKPDNILFNKYMQVKIGDFGLSRAFATESASHVSTRPAGTHGYLDPESFLTGRASKKTDVYSFGIILLQLVTGLPAVITRDKEAIHITNWIDPLIKRGGIQGIIDQRLNGKSNINAAQKAIEIAMSCVKPITERPDMSHVLAELKECLDVEIPSKVTNVPGRIYTNSTKSLKGAIRKSMEELQRRFWNIKFFTYNQIAEITSNFKTVIEKGGVGKVYLGTLNGGTQVAVKVLSPSSIKDYKEFLVKEELSIYHENVVCLVGYCDDVIKGISALIYEYSNNGNLRQHLSVERISPQELRCRTAYDEEELQDGGICRPIAGLEFMQTHGRFFKILPLKTSDILLDENMRAKIGNFRSDEKPYNPLDLEETKKNAFVYSLGIILLELITGQHMMVSAEEYDSHIIERVGHAIKAGDIERIFDPNLEGNFSIITACKTAKLAMSCAQKMADLNHVIVELKKCLTSEIIHELHHYYLKMATNLARR